MAPAFPPVTTTSMMIFWTTTTLWIVVVLVLTTGFFVVVDDHHSCAAAKSLGESIRADAPNNNTNDENENKNNVDTKKKTLLSSYLHKLVVKEQHAFLQQRKNNNNNTTMNNSSSSDVGGRRRRRLLEDDDAKNVMMKSEATTAPGPPVFHPNEAMLSGSTTFSIHHSSVEDVILPETTVIRYDDDDDDFYYYDDYDGDYYDDIDQEVADDSEALHKRYHIHFKSSIIFEEKSQFSPGNAMRSQEIALDRDVLQQACDEFLGGESWCGEDERERALQISSSSSTTAADDDVIDQNDDGDDNGAASGRVKDGILEHLLIVSAWLTPEEVSRLRVALRPFVQFIEEDAMVELPDHGERVTRESHILHVDDDIPDPSIEPAMAMQMVLERAGIHHRFHSHDDDNDDNDEAPPPPIITISDRSASSVTTSSSGFINETTPVSERIDMLRSRMRTGQSIFEIGGSATSSAAATPVAVTASSAKSAAAGFGFLAQQERSGQNNYKTRQNGQRRGSYSRTNENNVQQPSTTNKAFSWALDRIDQQSLPLDSTYTTPHKFTGKGVTIWVLDTGLNSNHVEFKGKNKIASAMGRSFRTSDKTTADRFGHGSHVAGLACGLNTGVAPGANVVPMAVMDSKGKGRVDHVVQALNHIYGLASQAVPLSSGDKLPDDEVNPQSRAGQIALARSSVVVMSLRGPHSYTLNSIIEKLSKVGVLCVTASGNDARDASPYSPPNSQHAITVGATTTNDNRAEYSNYGAVVDIMAPGSNARSAYHTGKNSYAALSGTSMAAPLVAGAAALILQAEPWMMPNEIKALLKNTCSKGKIRDLRGSANCMLNVNAFEDWLDEPYDNDDEVSPFSAFDRFSAIKKDNNNNKDDGDDNNERQKLKSSRSIKRTRDASKRIRKKRMEEDEKAIPLAKSRSPSSSPSQVGNRQEKDQEKEEEKKAEGVLKVGEKVGNEMDMVVDYGDLEDEILLDYADLWEWERVFPSIDEAADKSDQTTLLEKFGEPSPPTREEASKLHDGAEQPAIGDPAGFVVCASHAWELGRLDSGGGVARDVTANGAADQRCLRGSSNISSSSSSAGHRVYTGVPWDARLGGPAAQGNPPASSEDDAGTRGPEELLWRADGLWLDGDGSFLEMSPPPEAGLGGANAAAMNASFRSGGNGFALAMWVRVHEHRMHATLMDLHYVQSPSPSSSQDVLYRGGWSVRTSFDGLLDARAWRHQGSPVPMVAAAQRGVKRGSRSRQNKQQVVWNIDAIEAISSSKGALPEQKWAHVVLNVHGNSTATLHVNGTSVAVLEHTVTRQGSRDEDAKSFGLLPPPTGGNSTNDDSEVLAAGTATAGGDAAFTLRLLVGASAFPGGGDLTSLRARVADIRLYPQPIGVEEQRAIREWQLSRGVVGPLGGAPIEETAGMRDEFSARSCPAFLDNARTCGNVTAFANALGGNSNSTGSSDSIKGGTGAGTGTARTRTMVNGVMANLDSHGLPALLLEEDEVVLGCGLRCAIVGGRCMGTSSFCPFGAAVDSWCGKGGDGCVCCLPGLEPLGLTL